MSCGAAGSFSREDGDPWWPPPSPPRMPPSRRQGRSSSNPYSTRGLDKFSTVLADLQARREMITAKAREQGSPTVVRFVYSDGCWVPIVVRPPEQKKRATAAKDDAAAAKDAKTPPRMGYSKGAAHAGPAPNRLLQKSFPGKAAAAAGGGEGGRLFRWDPSYYWPAVVVLILMCLAFGRAFAICCTSVCWYSLPRTSVGENRKVRKGVRIENRRRAS